MEGIIVHKEIFEKKLFNIFCVIFVAMIFMGCCRSVLADDRALGSYQISIPSMVSPANAQNAVLAGSYLDGAVVVPGQIFSYNDTVGRRTSERGFIAGYISSTSKTAVKAVGGGVCTTASILHQAVKAAGLEVIERHNHVARTSYLPQGEDAAIWYGVEDYRFRNNLTNSVRIEAVVVDDALKISIHEINVNSQKEAGNIIMVNNTAIKVEQSPFEEQGILMLPVRPVVQALGADVYWDEVSQRVAIKYFTSVIRLQISEDSVAFDNSIIELETAIMLANGNTMAPASFFEEIFGLECKKDVETNYIVITNYPQSEEIIIDY